MGRIPAHSSAPRSLRSAETDFFLRLSSRPSFFPVHPSKGSLLRSPRQRKPRFVLRATVFYGASRGTSDKFETIRMRFEFLLNVETYYLLFFKIFAAQVNAEHIASAQLRPVEPQFEWEVLRKFILRRIFQTLLRRT